MYSNQKIPEPFCNYGKASPARPTPNSEPAEAAKSTLHATEEKQFIQNTHEKQDSSPLLALLLLGLLSS